MSNQRDKGQFSGAGPQAVCVTCGERHVERARRPGWCLRCDVREKFDRGKGVGELADYVGLPTFLVEEVLRT